MALWKCTRRKFWANSQSCSTSISALSSASNQWRTSSHVQTSIILKFTFLPVSKCLVIIYLLFIIQSCRSWKTTIKMSINVKIKWSGKCFNYELPQDAKIEELKAKIETETNVLAGRQKSGLSKQQHLMMGLNSCRDRWRATRNQRERWWSASRVVQGGKAGYDGR